MRRIRVTLIVEATVGGVRRHLIDIVNGIDRRIFDLRVICSSARDPSFDGDMDAIRAGGIPVWPVCMRREPVPGKDAAACLRILRLLRGRPCDIVHTHSSKAGALGRIAARLAGIPAIVHTPHVFAFDMRINALARGLYRGVERCLARRTDRIVSVCRAGMLSGARAGVAPAGAYVIIYNGVDAEALEAGVGHAPELKAALGIPAAAPVIGGVGRLAPQKNFGLLTAAARRVCAEFPDARFVVFGEGGERDRLCRDIAAAGLAGRFLLPGERRDIRRWYGMFDVFALSSDWEGMPYSLLEAMACRCAVAATDVGGVGEAIRSGENGVLTPPGRADRMAGALAGILRAAPAERRRMGIAARRTVGERFSGAGMLAALQAEYEKIITMKGISL